MTRVRIQKIILDKGVEEHIDEHDVTIDEAKEVIQSDAYTTEGHSGRKILVSRVKDRILSVIVEITGNKLRIKTARDASIEERKKFYEFEKRQK